MVWYVLGVEKVDPEMDEVQDEVGESYSAGLSERRPGRVLDEDIEEMGL